MSDQPPKGPLTTDELRKALGTLAVSQMRIVNVLLSMNAPQNTYTAMKTPQQVRSDLSECFGLADRIAQEMINRGG